ncbi:MAG: hypothetical protein DRR42_11040 [Gammaproteobacteria bacterium]|nr:MAG: hypothetical protein DRQ44_00010 [Gammaproteobacteria bacterium]RLA51199.1 MAG: hypothetical protein DRR42_11040 [Gammaproteobacteria bacterium]
MSFLSVEPLTLMISSRCQDKVEFNGKKQPMTLLRKAMKKKLEEIIVDGNQIFEVWIHEDESVTPGDQNSWDTCMSKSKKADIFLALYNGNAGWSGTSERLGDHVGICHAEFEAAFNKTPSKVRIIQLPTISAKPNSPNERFQKYFQQQGLQATQTTSGEDVIRSAKQAAVSALLDLARAGIGVGSKGSYFAGEALVWTRMDYMQRSNVMTNTAIEFLASRAHGEKATKLENTVILPVDKKKIAFTCHSIPASMSTAAARELVGQPFLRDHNICTKLPKNIRGPVHLIVCQKTVTEAQALRQLGFPDAIVVSAPFGIYVADDIQKIQMVFIASCRDETSTRHHVQRFLQWLTQQGEDRLLAQRARTRRLIGNLMARNV